MKNNYETFKRIYRKSAAEKIQEFFGVLVCVAVLIVIVAGILGVDLV